MADYSATPLSRKLGIRPGSRVLLVDAPSSFAALLEPLPDGVTFVTDADADLRRTADVAIVFAQRSEELARHFPRAMRALAADGGLWVAYPKRSSGVATDLAFAAVQRAGLEAGLVDNKSCAVDGTWSAVRFVVRKADRATWR